MSFKQGNKEVHGHGSDIKHMKNILKDFIHCLKEKSRISHVEHVDHLR